MIWISDFPKSLPVLSEKKLLNVWVAGYIILTSIFDGPVNKDGK